MVPARWTRWVALTVVLVTPQVASADGISARFGDLVATVGEDVVARVEVVDGRRITQRVAIELRRAGETTWRRLEAEQQPDAKWWVGTFTSTTVWREGGIRAPQPEYVELRAFLFGARGGVLLVIGEIEPLRVETMTAPETEARERALSRYSVDTSDDQLTLTGYVGTEGRAGSSARARAFIGVGGSIAQSLELLVYVGIGPSFARPTILEGGGPLVLAFDLALRFFARPPQDYTWSPFVEPFATVDLRLPGVDPGGGARAGILYRLSSEIAAELSIGGAVMVFNASDPDGREPEVGASGMLRLAIRFGGDEETATP